MSETKINLKGDGESTMRTILEGERLRLRPLEESDEDAVYEGARHEEIARYTLRIPHPYPRESCLPFIKRKIAEFKEGKAYSFAVELEGKLIGIVGLHDFSATDKSAKIGYWLNKDYWGKGYATEATRLALEFAFEDLGLHRVEGGAFAENKASQRVQEKLGFKREGVRREAIYRNDSWHDRVVMGILASEFKRGRA